MQRIISMWARCRAQRAVENGKRTQRYHERRRKKKKATAYKKKETNACWWKSRDKMEGCIGNGNAGVRMVRPEIRSMTVKRSGWDDNDDNNDDKIAVMRYIRASTEENYFLTLTLMRYKGVSGGSERLSRIDLEKKRKQKRGVLSNQIVITSWSSSLVVSH